MQKAVNGVIDIFTSEDMENIGFQSYWFVTGFPLFSI